MQDTTKVITGAVRFSYLEVFEPKARNDDEKAKYSVCLLIDKKDTKTLNKIKKAIESAYQAGKAKYGGTLPKVYKYPLRDGDDERPDSPEYEGMMFVNANSFNKVGLVDADLNPIINRDELYSGAYGRASINFFAFNFSGSKGVGCGLNNLQKLRDGERLSGGASAEEDFGVVGDDNMLG